MQKPLDIVFITPCVDEDFFTPVKKAANDAAKMFGASITFIGTEDVDIAQQIGLVEQAVARRCDGIALSMPHETAFGDVVDRALGAGIPVVSFNIDAKNSRLAGVSQNLYQAGRSVGRRAYPHISEGAHILLTQHSEGISALDDRMRGILEELAPKAVAHSLVITGMVPSAAADIVEKALLADASISAVIATGLADTEGAGLAKARLKKDSLYVAGFDLSENILNMVKEGVIDFTVDQQPYVQGFFPVAQLALNIRHGIMPVEIDTGAAIIDSSNVLGAIKAQREGYR